VKLGREVLRELGIVALVVAADQAASTRSERGTAQGNGTDNGSYGNRSMAHGSHDRPRR
jgi:hypothetical protein